MKPEEFRVGTVYKNPQGEERRVLALGVDIYGGQDDGKLSLVIEKIKQYEDE